MLTFALICTVHAKPHPGGEVVSAVVCFVSF